ncbi:unnamed protein product, partial [Rotaria sp. Silwood1]
MKLRQFFLFGFILCILIINISSIDSDLEGDDEDSSSVEDSHRSAMAERSMDSRSYSGACASSPCEHGGICTPRGQRLFDCKCVGPWRGVYCGI